MNVLVVNAGSSSLKYQLFDTSRETVLAKGNCERIGIDGRIEHRKGDKGEKIQKDIPMRTHADAIKIVVDYLTDPEVGVIKDMSEIEAVGHRIVHGGPYFFDSCLVDDDVIAKLNLCVDFAPLHTKAHLMGIEGCMAVMPNVPQVVVFDTSFHQTIPRKAATFPISYELAEKYKIRRYGAHGTSHRFVANKMIEILGKPREDTKIVTCHIGNGASVSAVKGGICMDTSMGFTPLDGLEMGTRCGSIDPAIVTYIMKRENMSPDEMNKYMNKKCGLLGVSGVSSDSRDVEEALLKGNERALTASMIMAYQIQKYIGAYAAAMNGLDAVVFTAGMGENSSKLRERVCTDMDYYGIEIDKEINDKTFGQPNSVEISTKNSRVKVYVIPTNEELAIAADTERLVKGISK